MTFRAIFALITRRTTCEQGNCSFMVLSFFIVDFMIFGLSNNPPLGMLQNAVTNWSGVTAISCPIEREMSEYLFDHSFKGRKIPPKSPAKSKPHFTPKSKS